jgi:hypothetical protein
MGFTAPTAEPAASNKHHRAGATDAANATSRRQSEVYDDEATQLAESFDTLASNLQGPSPKRPKGNQRSMILSQAPPKTPAAIPKSNPPPTVKSLSRHPLRRPTSIPPPSHRGNLLSTPRLRATIYRNSIWIWTWNSRKNSSLQVRHFLARMTKLPNNKLIMSATSVLLRLLTTPLICKA